ncbi:LysM peptidoglycan-binding domain-containing protein [Roseivirga sp. BDSF3-8]|uniref:lytic transglycosylase domain-containing protein n=1 Tax=Roseivirga sp. BDSF3-8 TaxID=3241598 RepID=UPI00353249CA
MKQLYIIFSLVVFSHLTGLAQLPSAENDFMTEAKEDEELYYPEYDYDYIPDASYDLVEDRLQCIENEIPLNFHPRVKSFVDYFTVRDRDYSRLMIERSTVYFPLFEKYLAEYGLPDELKYLSIVESGLAPGAVSRVGAVGLWQFMPATGRYFQLHQDFYIDQRMDPDEATRAACAYLKDLYRQFNDWELALASYNAGPGNVRRAIRRSGYKKTFWEIYDYLPRETRSYVPQFVAVTYMMNYHEEHNLHPQEYRYAMEQDTILVDHYVDLATLSSLVGLCPDDLKEMNPALYRAAVPDDISKYPIRIPSDVKELLDSNRVAFLDSASRVGRDRLEYLARHSVGSTYGRKHMTHRVRSGEVLGSIAQRYGVRVADIRAWNNIRGNLIRVNQRLNIYVWPGRSMSTASASTSSSKPVTTSSGGKKYYHVQPGDSLWSISKKYQGLSIEKIKELNNLKTNKIKPGQKLVIG